MVDNYGVMPIADSGTADTTKCTLTIDKNSSIVEYEVYFDDHRQGSYTRDKTFYDIAAGTLVEISIIEFADGYYHTLTLTDEDYIGFELEENTTIKLNANEVEYTPRLTITQTKTSITFSISRAYDYEDYYIEIDDEEYEGEINASTGKATITISNLTANTEYDYYIYLNSDITNDKIFEDSTSTASITLPEVTANFGEGTTLTTATSAILYINISDDFCEEYRVLLDGDTVIDWDGIPTHVDTFEETLENLSINTEYQVVVQVRGPNIGVNVSSETLKFKTLNGYTTYIYLVNIENVKVSSSIETKTVSSGGTILVVPNQMFTISDFSFNSNNCGSDAKGNSYSWPYSYPIVVTGEVSDIIESDSEEYKVTKNNESYTFTAHPKFWNWDDADTQPVAKQPTTSYSAKDWNKMISCLDTWLQFQGYEATSGTFLPQDSSYAFTKSVYNTARAGLIKVFTIPKDIPIMDEVESGLARQTSVSASKLINFGNIMCYNNLLPKEEEKE